MKIRPKKAALIGLAATTLFATSACRVNRNEESGVYGPPTDMTTEEDTEDVDSTEEITTDQNETPTVYGPPTDMGD